MSNHGPSTLGGVIAVVPVEDELRPERTPQSQLDAWAATLASTLAQQMPPPRAIPPPPTTEAWRPSVGALTPGSEATLGDPIQPQLELRSAPRVTVNRLLTPSVST